MNRLALKLTAGFIVVAIIAVGLVSYLANSATGNEFETYVSTSAAVPAPMLRNSVARLYPQDGDWSRVRPSLEELAELSGGRLIISDEAGRVLVDSAGQAEGRALSDPEKAVRVPLKAGAPSLGYLGYVPSGGMSAHTPSGPMGMMRGMMAWQSDTDASGSALGGTEKAFLSAVNGSLWAAGLIAAMIAAGLGLLFVRQITSPLSRLTIAAAAIARGDLDQRVPVRSNDEVGQLGTAFNAMADNLAVNEQARRQLVADIAHELRTPLTVIQANLEAMRDGVVEPTADRLKSVHEESLLLARLVDDLRVLSLADAGALQLHKEPSDIGDLAIRAVASIEEIAGQREVSISTEINWDALVTVDPDRIGQVLRNLLNNAVKYAKAGGRIAVSVAPGAGPNTADDGRLPTTGGWVQVSVTDTGSGIAEDDLPHVFDRFYRVDKSRTRASGGSGIGLAIVKQLVEAHGGVVSVKSEPGVGSVFSFMLPA